MGPLQIPRDKGTRAPAGASRAGIARRVARLARVVPAVLGASLLLAACAGAADSSLAPDSTCSRNAPDPPATAIKTKVKRVVDGDTFIAADGTRVRLLGINTPESVDPRRPVEYYGKEASAFTRRLLQGKRVLIQPGQNPRDAHGRMLAWVWREGGLFVNGELVRLGYAQVYTFADNPDNAQYLVQCQREARTARRGLWGR